MKIVPDTSVIIDGKVSEFVSKKKKPTVVIPEIVLGELENQANSGRKTGFEGLEEIKRLGALAKKGKIRLEFAGKRATADEIRLAKRGLLDAMIRECAEKRGATLLTADIVQAEVAKAKGISCEYFEKVEKKLLVEKYFSGRTQSVHLKEDVVPKAKVGTPGSVQLKKLGTKALTQEDVEALKRNIAEQARISGRVEMRMNGAGIYQIGDFRISVTEPPFSDSVEITAVRPIKKMALADYGIKESLMSRFERAEGILISGPPGSGKSTFAAALAEFYLGKGKVVKTLERPRDLRVSREITQYTALEGGMDKSADVLLLVRPDFTIFDELRRTSDFSTYADLRLAGVGMVGVVHATEPIEAIQRLIGRLELGMIPQLIDTIVHIGAGEVQKVLKLDFGVSIPDGMMDDDLARPVIAVKDFFTDRVEYEIYSYGEEIVVMPYKGKKHTGISSLAERALQNELSHVCREFEVEVVGSNTIEVRLPREEIARFIGREGKKVRNLEKQLGLSIRVEPLD